MAPDPGVPGRFNVANAAVATLAAEALGVDRSAAAAAIATVREVEGRFARVTIAVVVIGSWIGFVRRQRRTHESAVPESVGSRGR